MANALAFAAPFALVYGVLAAVTLAVSAASDESLIGDRTKHLLGLAVGLLLLALALVTWLRGRRPLRTPAGKSRLLTAVESARPAAAFGIGLVEAVLNPNIAILFAGLFTIAAADAAVATQVVGAVFLVAAAEVFLLVPSPGTPPTATPPRALGRATGWLASTSTKSISPSSSSSACSSPSAPAGLREAAALPLGHRGLRRPDAARRRRRRPDGLGGARPGGARVRLDRRRVARRRPLRGARRARPLRRLRQLAPPRHRADGRDRRAVGGRRGRPRRRRVGRVRCSSRSRSRSSSGSLALVAGVLRLGFLASFISEPVLKGFIIGLALTIIVGQLPKLFGVEKGEGNFFEQLWDLLASSATRAG